MFHFYTLRGNAQHGGWPRQVNPLFYFLFLSSFHFCPPFPNLSLYVLFLFTLLSFLPLLPNSCSTSFLPSYFKLLTFCFSSFLPPFPYKLILYSFSFPFLNSYSNFSKSVIVPIYFSSFLLSSISLSLNPSLFCSSPTPFPSPSLCVLSLSLPLQKYP